MKLFRGFLQKCPFLPANGIVDFNVNDVIETNAHAWLDKIHVSHTAPPPVSHKAPVGK